MNKWIYISITVVIVVIAVLVGVFLFNLNSHNPNNLQTYESKNTNVVDVENEIENTLGDISVISTVEKEKVSPNAILILKKHYNECGHDIKEYTQIPEEYVNLTSEELQEEYKEWEIETFYPHEITLIKYEDGNCNEHYILKEENGVIVVYHINENNEEELEKETSISTEYLTLQDQERLKTGIKIYGKEELNSTLEDYE